jgi:hypothetical protein
MIRVHAKCYFSGDSIDSNAWISDGGSNRHATNDKDYFIDGSARPVDVAVDVGSGSTPCALMGNVMLHDSETEQYTGNKNDLNSANVLKAGRLFSSRPEFCHRILTSWIQDGTLPTVLNPGW